MRTIITTSAIVLLMAGCSTAPALSTSAQPYWARPGATRDELVNDTTACYRASLDDQYPSALPGATSNSKVLPLSEPPPRIWTLSPRETGLERFDEQLRYERCMRDRGWLATRTTPL